MHRHFVIKMTEAARRALSLKRKKRGVTRASITKLGYGVQELEDSDILPDTADSARRLTKRLEALSAEFKGHHFDVIELLDDEDDLEKEQEIYDLQDEEINRLSICLEKLISSSSTADLGQHKVLLKRLKNTMKGLTNILDNISPFPVDGDVHTLQQYEEHLGELKKEFSPLKLKTLVSLVYLFLGLRKLRFALHSNFGNSCILVQLLRRLIRKVSSSQSSTCLHSTVISSIGRLSGSSLRLQFTSELT